MFSNAENLSIRDTTINNAGGDITIVHNHNMVYHDPEPSPSNLLSQISNLFSVTIPRWSSTHLTQLGQSARSHMFHTAEILKSVLPTGFLTSPEICLEEKIAEDALKYPPLMNAKILLSKTSMCIPGFVAQTLSSVRYSFF